MKISRKKIIVISSSIAVFILLILLVSLKKKPSDKSETLPAVVIQKPVRQNLDESITITGYVEAKTMIPVVPFVNGTIMEYPAKAGDFVTLSLNSSFTSYSFLKCSTSLISDSFTPCSLKLSNISIYYLLCFAAANCSRPTISKQQRRNNSASALYA